MRFLSSDPRRGLANTPKNEEILGGGDSRQPESDSRRREKPVRASRRHEAIRKARAARQRTRLRNRSRVEKEERSNQYQKRDSANNRGREESKRDSARGVNPRRA
jgi:hypothetical protein